MMSKRFLMCKVCSYMEAVFYNFSLVSTSPSSYFKEWEKIVVCPLVSLMVEMVGWRRGNCQGIVV